MAWDWRVGGLMLGLTFFLAVLLVKPIGVSTQFVIADGVVASRIDPALVQEDPARPSGYRSTNAYLDKSGGTYAKAVARPINYGFIFVLAIIPGAFLGRLFTRRGARGGAIKQLPDVHVARFGARVGVRYVLAFLGGVLGLWGARLAGGCTSGHMMSGMMQTSVSGFFFAAAAFLAAIPTAMLVYRRSS